MIRSERSAEQAKGHLLGLGILVAGRLEGDADRTECLFDLDVGCAPLVDHAGEGNGCRAGPLRLQTRELCEHRVRLGADAVGGRPHTGSCGKNRIAVYGIDGQGNLPMS